MPHLDLRYLGDGASAMDTMAIKLLQRTSIAADCVLQYDVSVDSKDLFETNIAPRKFHAAPGSLTHTSIEHLHMEIRRCGEGKDNAMHVCFGNFTVPKQVLACHKSRQYVGPATTQNLVVKFDGEICGGVLVENASAKFPSKRSSKISFQTSPEVRRQFRRKLRQLHSGNRWCLNMNSGGGAMNTT